jgi:transcriptional regulator with XRE-family HTH domain
MSLDVLSQSKLNNAGETIAQHRRSRGMTLTDVANATGLSMAHVSRIERGERAPSLGVLFQLSHAYGVPLGTLVGEDQSESDVLDRPSLDFRAASEEVLYRPVGPSEQVGTQRIVLVDLPQGGSTPVSEHEGAEWLFVAEGAVTLNVDPMHMELATGSSVNFDAAKPHFLYCTEGPARLILVTLSPLGTEPDHGTTAG